LRKVAINGLGRIGRLTLRQLMKAPQVQVVAVNDLADAAALAYLLKHDSVHGLADFPVAAEGDHLLLAGQRIRVFSEPAPGAIPFTSEGAQLVLECTGRFSERNLAMAHLQGSVQRVLIGSASSDADLTMVPGVNDDALDLARHHVISCGSGTTQALAPMVKVLDDAFGLEHGFVTTVHSYTNDQRILDLPHPDLRRTRAAAHNMIPTSTEAPLAVGQVLPHLAGRLAGLAVRVPTPDVSILDLTALLRREASVTEVHRAFQQAAVEGPLAPYLEVLDEELVSRDLVGRSASCLYDPFLTKALGARLVKVFGWYDNEFAYAARMKDLCLCLLGEARP